MMIAIDSETTGLDLRHGTKPYLVTTCDKEGKQRWWEWPVDPETREPKIPAKDKQEITATIKRAKFLVLQNPKFDFTALAAIGLEPREGWPWHKVRDTLLAGHLLASNQPHDLTTMVLIYLGVNVKPHEDKIEQATKECRRLCQSKTTEYPTWQIAEKDRADMPSAKEKTWKFDMWLPRAMADARDLPEDHEYRTLCAEYANSDSETTMALYLRQRELLKERGLWRIYLERLKVLPIVYEMENAGVTISAKRLKELVADYTMESRKAARTCLSVASSYGVKLTLPKSGNNNQLLELIFDEDKLALPAVKTSKKTGKPSLDKETLDHYEATLPEKSKAMQFIRALKGKRKRDTALQYMASYRKFWLPIGYLQCKDLRFLDITSEWFRLHPSLNPTGTDTLRWSSQNPNEQNISKQAGFNLRYSFGPAPGREWYSLDAKNIELRLPAYESGETEQIELFEKPDEPPFYGSNHLLVFSILHPDKWDHDDPEGLLKAKKKYASTWYSWTKNGNFAVQYGAVETSGTADRAYHVKGAQHRIQSRFQKGAELNRKMIEHAEEFGFVETMPDRTVDPERGYPLLCTRTRWGGIKPTVPLNYHVQGTAMWWMMKAMIRCYACLKKLNRERKPSQQIKMIMQVHDEIVFDFPKRSGNLAIVRRLARLMAKGGDDLVPRVPTPVSIERHSKTWSEGVTL